MFVKMNNLSFRYKNAGEYALEDFNLEINKGEILCILGESGSGKSTVLRLLSGLEIPNKGFIEISHKVMFDKSTFITPEKRGIGMVFQDYALFPHMTVGQNIQFGLKNSNKTEKKLIAREMLKLLDLEKFESRYPYELSGGQQQRVALGRALAPRPLLLLLDEPFSSLDANLKGRIREDLKKIITQVGITTIFVSHDHHDAQVMADRVLIVQQGKVVQEGTTQDVMPYLDSKSKTSQA